MIEVKNLVIELGEPWFLKKFSSRKASASLIALAMKITGWKIPKNHDLYIMSVFPSNFVNRKPNILVCHEPPRRLYDLKKETLDELP